MIKDKKLRTAKTICDERTNFSRKEKGTFANGDHYLLDNLARFFVRQRYIELKRRKEGIERR